MEMIKSALKWLWREAFPRVPILGPLLQCRAQDHVAACREFFGILFWSTATFWMTAFFLLAVSANSDKGIVEVIYQTVSAGQLFVFSVSFIGPIVAAVGRDPPRARIFPGRVGHFSAFLALVATAAGFYAMELIAGNEATSALLNKDFLFVASVVIASTVVVLRYLTMVYRQSTLEFDAESQLRTPTDDFAKEFIERH